MSGDTEATTATFGWNVINGEGTCDGCSEHQPLRYEWPETEAWLCAECWHDATETDRLRAEVERLRAYVRAVEEVLAESGTDIETLTGVRRAVVVETET